MKLLEGKKAVILDDVISTGSADKATEYIGKHLENVDHLFEA